ncbi:hypothetical protein BH11PLA1_BH11PLA1_05810 [soil metagenome]
MAGITSNTGIFSGIDSASLINQLVALDARPKAIYQNRISQIQGLQAAYLDVNSKINGLKTAAQAFNLNNLFKAAKASSSLPDVLAANATTGATPGTYNFVVDRLASTQQSLSTGFASSSQGLNASSITIESAQARLDRDTALSTLNGGQGIARGRLTVTDSSGANTTIDLSRAGTVNDVLNAFNSAAGVRVHARVEGDRFVIEDAAGGAGTVTVADGVNSTTATSLGIVGAGVSGKINGSRVNTIGGRTALTTLNGGLGVGISAVASSATTPDFRITTRGGNSYDIDIGAQHTLVSGVLTQTAAPVTDLEGVVQRINDQSGGAITASIDPATNGLRLVDNSVPDSGGDFSVTELTGGSTARDLGLLGTTSGDTIAGTRLVGALNSTLVRNLRGGAGIVGDGAFNVQTADGSTISLTLGASQSTSDIVAAFNSAAAGKATLTLDSSGTTFTLKDNTTGVGARKVTGDGAKTLGFDVEGYDSGTVKSTRSQLKYIGLSSRVADLNGGAGIGTGQIELVNSYGTRSVFSIDSSITTVGDLLKRLNSAASDIRARINDNGDGIQIEEVARPSGTGGQRISIRDVSGGVAKNLNLVGTASGVGAANKIDGTFERSIALTAGDSLETINTKINALGVFVSSSVLNDGSPGRPYRLSLTARSTGEAGAFVIDSTGIDLAFQNTANAQNARVFYGSADAAQGILLSSTTNTITGAIDKVSIDLKTASATPVVVTVGRDNGALEKGVNDFVTAFNSVIGSIDSKSTYDPDTKKKGILLGDGTTQALRAELFATVTGPPKGITGRYRSLGEIGLTTKNGQLSLDTEKLRSAIATDPGAVAQLLTAKTADAASTDTTPIPLLDGNGAPIPGVFVTPTPVSARYTAQGIFEKFGALADRYINGTDGVLTRQTRVLDTQVTFANTKLGDIDATVERHRALLQRQFLAMEEAIGKLQSQSGSISSLASLAARSGG